MDASTISVWAPAGLKLVDVDDDVRIRGDGIKMDSACIVMEHVCDIMVIRYGHYQL